MFFYEKMSHIISLKVTKFQQPLLITLRVADEKPERGGGKKPPPRGIGLIGANSRKNVRDIEEFELNGSRDIEVQLYRYV